MLYSISMNSRIDFNPMDTDDNDDTTKLPLQRINVCEVCAKTDAKYTCPRCEVRTCCLKCINIHKKELECDGIRDKVKFKVMKDFNNIDLLNDYRFLEETARLVNQSAKLPPTSCYSAKCGTLPVDLYRLKCTASSRGVFLYFLPPNFSRHISNSSYLNHETQEFYWHIDWIFGQAENFTLTDKRVLDSSILSACVHKYIDPEENIHPCLAFYQAAGHSGIKLLLKAERTVSNRYYLLDPSITLRENLQGKPIVEYPVIYVVLSHHISTYNILSEEEEQNLTKKRRRTHNARNRSKQRYVTNFLFSSTNDREGHESNDEEFDKEASSIGEPKQHEEHYKQNFNSSHGRGRRGKFRGRWHRNDRRGMNHRRPNRGRNGNTSDRVMNGLSNNLSSVNI